jgi:phosphoglycolate phosphatase
MWQTRYYHGETSKPLTPIAHDIQLILFDIDGTLLLPKGAGRASTKLAMLEVFNTDSGIDQHNFGGKTDWHTLNELLATEGYDRDSVREMIPAYQICVARHLNRIIGDYPVESCPGALEVVAELHRRNSPLLGIVTGNVSTTAPIKLRAAGFDPDWFAVGAYGSESPDRNDLPFLAVRRAERQLNRLILPEGVIVIGDTPADVACARALGAIAVVVMTGYSSREEMMATQPDYLLDDLTSFFGQVMM